MCSIATHTHTHTHTHPYLDIHSMQTWVQIPLSQEQEQQASSPVYLQSQSLKEQWPCREIYHLRERLPLLELRTGWEREQQAKRITWQNVGPNPSPISTEHTAKLWSPRVARWAEVARGASPPAAAGHLPAVARLSPAWRGRCLRFGKGFPSHITRRGSRRHTDASAGSGAAVLFRPVPVGSRVLAGTEITMQRAEAARRSRAETAGATPHSGTAAAAARHWAKLEVGVHVPDCSSVRPGLRPSVLAGQCCPAWVSEEGAAGAQRAAAEAPAAPAAAAAAAAAAAGRRAPPPPRPRPAFRPAGRGCGGGCCGPGGIRAPAGGLRCCCKETSSRWKVQKEIKIEGRGPEQLRRNSGPRSTRRSPDSMAVSWLQHTGSSRAKCRDLKPRRPSEVSSVLQKVWCPAYLENALLTVFLPPAPYRPNSPLLGMDGFGKRPLKVAPATLNGCVVWLAAADGANETEKR